MNYLQQSSVNMLVSATGYVVPMVINFITMPLLLHALGEAAYGLQSMASVVIGYFTLMDMGFDLPITKYLAEDNARNDTEAQNHLLSTTLQMYILIGLVGMLAIMFSADFLALRVFRVPDELVGPATMVFHLAGIGFLGSVGMSWGRAVGMGLQRFDVIYPILIATNLSGTILGLGAVYAGYGVVGYVLIRVITSLLGGPMYWLVIVRLLPQFHFHWGLHRPTLLRVRGYVGFGVLNRALGSLVSRLDQTLIAAWVGVAAAGLYAVPLMIVNSLGYMIAYMLGFTFPMASELHSLGQLERLRDIFMRATRFIAALTTMIFVPLLVLGDLFLTLWVGPSVAEKTTMVFCLLSWSTYIGILTATLTNNVLVGTGRIRQFAIYSVIRGVVLGAWCVLLIRPFGIEGAALALLLTEAVDVIYFVFVTRRYLQISPQELFLAYLKPIFLGITLVALSFLVRPLVNSWMGIVLVVGVLELLYVIAGYLLGVFGGTEKRAVVGLGQLATRSLRLSKDRHQSQ